MRARQKAVALKVGPLRHICHERIWDKNVELSLPSPRQPYTSAIPDVYLVGVVEL